MSFGLCLAYGKGIECDWLEAARYYKLSSDSGNSDGSLQYGLCLRHGRGVPEDAGQALRYLRLSARRGNECARRILEVDQVSWSSDEEEDDDWDLDRK